MKILSHTDASILGDAATDPSLSKVCMHVLGVVRNDNRIMREATALKKAGFAVSIVDVESEDIRLVEENIRGVYVKHILVSSSFISTRFDRWTLIRAVKLLVLSILLLIRTPADFYHAHDITALPACYIAARLRGKPLVFDLHELPLFDRRWSEMSRSKRLLFKLIAAFLPRILVRCAGVIASSPGHAQEFRKRYLCPEITLVRNVPPYCQVPQSDRLCQQLGLRSDVCIGLYQGNIQPNRQLDILIRAAPFLAPDTVIVMMGESDPDTQAQLEDLIDSEGVADRVKIIPPVPYEELLTWTASADIGLNVLPPDYSLSIRMCLPNKLFEYLMVGLPVLTSQLDAVVDVVKSYDVGQVVFSLAPEDVAAAINTMLADRAALARMRRNALEATKREFCWEKESPQLIGLYQKKLSSSSISKGTQRS